MCFGMGFSLHCSNPPSETLNTTHPRYATVSLDVDNECRVYKVYLVTYASKTTRGDFCTMALSAFANGFELNILGKKREAQWEIYSYLDKFWALREFISLLSNEPNAIVIFADAYDVLFTAGPRTLVKRFIKSGKRILISAEKGCCSDWLTTVEGYYTGVPVLCDATWPVPEIGTAMPYMNSGAFVGFQAPPCPHLTPFQAGIPSPPPRDPPRPKPRPPRPERRGAGGGARMDRSLRAGERLRRARQGPLRPPPPPPAA